MTRVAVLIHPMLLALLAVMVSRIIWKLKLMV